MRIAVMAMFLLTWCVSTASAGMEEWYLYPSFQYFTWGEFHGGRRIIREEGALFGVGGGASFDLARKNLMLRVKGELFGGDVDYHGQTQIDPDPTLSERPVKTSVIYFGTKLDGDLGWRFPISSGWVEPFAGLGFRWWLRDLQDTTAVDTNGNTFDVGGYSETWYTLYTRTGLRGGLPVGSDAVLFAEGGAKYSFYNRNVADFPGTGNVTLEPDPRWSLFAEIGARYGRFRPTIFYEGLRYGESPAVPIGGGLGLVQPKSEADIVGLNLSWVFR